VPCATTGTFGRTQGGNSVILDTLLGKGGEGSVFGVVGDPGLAVKVYAASSPDREAKLRAMLATRQTTLDTFCAWPQALITFPGGEIGFAMPRLDGAWHSIDRLGSPRDRKQHFPDATWRFLVHTAANLARSFGAVHAAGHLVGDVNENNIRVKPSGLVRLIDCDGFQVNHGGRTYRCTVGVPTHTPPELQKVNLKDVDRTADHDHFGLAIMIFQLLFLGRHPFAGTPLQSKDVPLEEAIATGRFAYLPVPPPNGLQRPPHAPALSIVPEEIAKLFCRAFALPTGGAPRPSADEWIASLDRLRAGLRQCRVEKRHEYAGHESSCPWCSIEAGVKKPGFSIFGQSAGASARTISGADWTEIESKLTELLLPINVPPPASSLIPASQASSFAQDLVKARREEYDRAVLQRHTADKQHKEAEGHYQVELKEVSARNALAMEAHGVACERAKSEHALLTARLDEEYRAATGSRSPLESHLFPASKIGLPISAALWFVFWLQGGFAAPLVAHIWGVMAFGAVVTAATVAYLYGKTNSSPRPTQPQLVLPPPPNLEANPPPPKPPVVPVPTPISWSDAAFAEIHRRGADDTNLFTQAISSHAVQVGRVGTLLAHPQFGPAHRQAQNLLAEAKQVLQQRQRRIAQLSGTARQRALEQFLSTRRLEEGMVEGVGPSRIGTLRSFGVYTAADIDPIKVARIPGFGPVLQGKLQNWRSSIERSWVAPTYIAPSAADIAGVDASITQERSSLARKVLPLLVDLQRFHAKVLDDLTRSANLVNELAVRAGQSEADVRMLKAMFP
jgi:DNA-binding helix-hairpin-helix protein with protein kinase domain